ncbi:hypothetical protein R6Q59_001541 [Mikania micrantha]
MLLSTLKNPKIDDSTHPCRPRERRKHEYMGAVKNRYKHLPKIWEDPIQKAKGGCLMLLTPLSFGMAMNLHQEMYFVLHSFLIYLMMIFFLQRKRRVGVLAMIRASSDVNNNMDDIVNQLDYISFDLPKNLDINFLVVGWMACAEKTVLLSFCPSLVHRLLLSKAQNVPFRIVQSLHKAVVIAQNEGQFAMAHVLRPKAACRINVTQTTIQSNYLGMFHVLKVLVMDVVFLTIIIQFMFSFQFHYFLAHLLWELIYCLRQTNSAHHLTHVVQLICMVTLSPCTSICNSIHMKR